MLLNTIQQQLKAPKSQRNTFGNYNYRNAEDILEAVKPLLQDAVLTVTDDLVLIGARYYIKATATLFDPKEGISSSVSAFAREADEQKGMNEAQITGSASSYARKYALNGLFCIDDTKDDDSTNNHEDKTPTVKPEVKAEVKTYTGTTTKKLSDKQRDMIFRQLDILQIDIAAYEKKIGKTIANLTITDASKCIDALVARVKDIKNPAVSDSQGRDDEGFQAQNHPVETAVQYPVEEINPDDIPF